MVCFVWQQPFHAVHSAESADSVYPALSSAVRGVTIAIASALFLGFGLQMLYDLQDMRYRHGARAFVSHHLNAVWQPVGSA